MNNEKFSDFSHFLSSPGKLTKKYLLFAATAYIVAGIVCAGFYLDMFGFVDRANAYILADELLCSMIRSTTAAAFFTLLIDYLEQATNSIT